MGWGGGGTGPEHLDLKRLTVRLAGLSPSSTGGVRLLALCKIAGVFPNTPMEISIPVH